MDWNFLMYKYYHYHPNDSKISLKNISSPSKILNPHHSSTKPYTTHQNQTYLLT